MTEQDKTKRYLGDGVYASFDGYQVWLETSVQYEDGSKIALEPDVFNALRNYVERIPDMLTRIKQSA